VESTKDEHGRVELWGEHEPAQRRIVAEVEVALVPVRIPVPSGPVVATRDHDVELHAAGAKDLALERVAGWRPRADDYLGLVDAQRGPGVLTDDRFRVSHAIAPAVVVGRNDLNTAFGQEPRQTTITGRDLEATTVADQLGEAGDKLAGVEAIDPLGTYERHEKSTLP